MIEDCALLTSEVDHLIKYSCGYTIVPELGYVLSARMALEEGGPWLMYCSPDLSLNTDVDDADDASEKLGDWLHQSTVVCAGCLPFS